MKKAIILIFVMFLVALSTVIADDSQLSVDVSNAAPDVTSIVVAPDDRGAEGVQITIGDVVVRVNATIEELNGIGQVEYVKAYVTGPSTIEESPITLTKVADIDSTHAIYNGNFGMSESDSLGEYSVNVEVSDSVVTDSLSINFNYVNPPNTRITVCASGCNFTTIQAAVDAALTGYTVYVYDGVYSYFSVVGKSGLKIIGESLNVKIAGDNAHSDIIFDNVADSELINFTVYDGWQGVFVDESTNNNFTNIVSYSNTNHGFVLVEGSNGNSLTGVEAYDNVYDGVYVLNSDGNIISGYTGTNNENGVYIENSNSNQVINSDMQKNDVGLVVYSGNYSVITGNTLYHNIRGMSFTFGESRYISTINSNNYRNKVCDINYGSYLVCEYDYTAPAKITDLSGVSGSANKKIDLSWTDVGENWEYGVASSYVLKYSTSDINEGNWDSATTYDTLLWNPSANGTAVDKTVTMPDFGTYYFAMKAKDDANNLGEISDSIAVLSPHYNINVDSVGCVNGKNGYACNYTLSGSTNYLYDTLNLSGNVTNSGNLDETKTVEAKINGIKDTRDVFFEKSTTTLVSDMQMLLDDLNSITSYAATMEVGSSFKSHLNVKAWSIKDYTGTKWWSVDSFPSTTETAGEPFYVMIKMKNDNTVKSYYDYPVEISIDDTFSVISVGAGNDFWCENGSKKCYYKLQLGRGYSTEYIYWYVDGMPAGTYEISVNAGVHPADSPDVLTRTVIVE